MSVEAQPLPAIGPSTVLPPGFRLLPSTPFRPGRVAVLWKIEKDDFIQVPDWIRTKHEQLHNAAWECRRCQVLQSTYRGIRKGDTAIVRSDAANLSLDNTDYPSIPEGYEVRIYGVTEEICSNDWDLKEIGGRERYVRVPPCIMGIERAR